MDFYPTLLEAAGLELPADEPLDGESLMPILRQSGHLVRQRLFLP